VNVSGHIVFKGAADRQKASVWLESATESDGCSGGSFILEMATGVFSIEGAFPSRCFIRAGGAERQTSPWMLAAATLGGRDILDEPIDLPPGADLTGIVLTLTDRPRPSTSPSRRRN
jgi:hypothetical protein